MIYKYIPNILIKSFLKEYYNNDDVEIYQGDPISPLLFSIITDLIIKDLEVISNDLLMYADDVIIILRDNNELQMNLDLIYKIYNKYAEMLSGDTYSTPKVGEGKNLCDFNTIKYEN